MWVAGWRTRAKTEGGWGKNAKDSLAIKCNKSHKALGLTRVHAKIDRTLKAQYEPLVGTHRLLHPLQKSETNVQVLWTHTHRHSPYTLEAWIITRIY